MKLLVIAVSYRTPVDAARFASSLLEKCRSRDLDLVIVDNSEVPDLALEASMLPPSEGRLTLVHAQRNLGYLGGAVLGLQAYLSQNKWPDWVAVSNVDLEIRDPEAFLKTLARHAGSQVGVIAPRIVREDTGRDLNPFMRSRPTALRMWTYALLFNWYAGLAAYDVMAAMKRKILRWRSRSAGESRGLSENSETIYAAHGSFFCLSAEYFRRGGELAYEPFLFGEEIHVAEQARLLSLRVVHEPSAVVVHRANASMRLVRGRVIHGFVRDSSFYVARRYFGLGESRRGISGEETRSGDHGKAEL